MMVLRNPMKEQKQRLLVKMRPVSRTIKMSNYNCKTSNT